MTDHEGNASMFRREALQAYRRPDDRHTAPDFRATWLVWPPLAVVLLLVACAFGARRVSVAEPIESTVTIHADKAVFDDVVPVQETLVWIAWPGGSCALVAGESLTATTCGAAPRGLALRAHWEDRVTLWDVLVGRR